MTPALLRRTMGLWHWDFNSVSAILNGNLRVPAKPNQAKRGGERMKGFY